MTFFLYSFVLVHTTRAIKDRDGEMSTRAEISTKLRGWKTPTPQAPRPSGTQTGQVTPAYTMDRGMAKAGEQKKEIKIGVKPQQSPCYVLGINPVQSQLYHQRGGGVQCQEKRGGREGEGRKGRRHQDR